MIRKSSRSPRVLDESSTHVRGPHAGRRTILYVGAFRFPDRNAAAMRARANAALFRSAGYDVVLIGHAEPGEANANGEILDGFKYHSLPAPKGMFGWARYVFGREDLLSSVRRLAGELFAVVCYNFPAIPMFRLRKLGRRYGFSVLSDVTEWYDASGGPLLFRAAKYLDTTLRMRVANRFMDGLITTSPVITSYYRNAGLPLVELPTLFDARHFAPPVDLPPTPPTFVYAGSPFAVERVNRKRTNVKDRLDISIEAFAALQSEGLVFLFEVYGVTRDQYLVVYPEHGLLLERAGASIRFRGQVASSTVRAAVAAANFTVFFRDPTRTVLAGFPTKLAESVTAGTPVITSDLENVRQLRGAPEVWLAARGDEVEWLRRALSLSTEQGQALKRACFDSRRFDISRYVEDVRLFARAVNREAGG